MNYLGIDTSNYTTSIAVVKGDEIICDARIPLRVPENQFGLRQSEALYQHWKNLPEILSGPLCEYSSSLAGICVSNAPRPVKGSYMPVFQAGVSVARILSDTLSLPLYETSHQEGHIMAGALNGEIDFKKPLLAAHLSGGTTEILRLDGGTCEIAGGTLDISYGQLIDRTGALLGLRFPAGKELDEMAIACNGKKNVSLISRISRKGSWINLSGTETQLKRLGGDIRADEVASSLFTRMAQSLIDIIEHLKERYGIEQVLITGGVAASQMLRLLCKDYNYVFGPPALCTDNAVGVALLKGEPLWR